MPVAVILAAAFWLAAPSAGPQQVTGQDLDKILERADALLEEAKKLYDGARVSASSAAFVDAGFKLEEARIKYIVLQEIGTPEKQKTAADQLRTVQQLNKLINDGKKAAAGPSVSPEAPTAKAPDSPAPPPVEPPKVVIDVARRQRVPEAARQKEAEKLIRDLFKDQYAKKAPADRKVLSQQLLELAAKSNDDAAALWVLTREAQDAAAQVGDVRLALEAVEMAARSFDIDALAMKGAAIAAAAKAAKIPEEFAALVDASMALIEELIRADQYDAADKTAIAAVQHARRTNDAALVAKATTRAKEVSEAKTLYQGMKKVLETLAKSPDDPGANSEMGKYLCYVKGSWDLGLRFLIKGSDAALKSLAEKESSLAASSAERMAIADAWFELTEKEKSPLRKKELSLHTRGLYQSALADASSLARVRIEKRLEALQTPAPGALPAGAVVDLTTLTAKSASVGWGTFGVNSNEMNAQVNVKGKDCKQYLWAHAPSTLIYDIPPGSRTFTAVGARLDKNNAGIQGTWKYFVIVDGKKLFESKVLTDYKGMEVDISVPLPPGAKELQLKVDPLSDFLTDWAIWANPTLTR